jgi:hypothetical protein
VLCAPPPCLMDDGSVSRVHEADDAVVDADGHFRLQIGHLEFRTELLDLRRRVGGLGWLGETRTRRSGIGNINPDETVLLFAGITSGIDAIKLQSLIGSERGDQLTLSVVHIELPSVVRAFEIFAVKLAAIKWHSAVRARIAKRERMSLAIAPDDERKFQQHCLVKLIAMDAIGRQRTIPEVGEHQGIGCLALRRVKFGHGLRALC